MLFPIRLLSRLTKKPSSPPTKVEFPIQFTMSYAAVQTFDRGQTREICKKQGKYFKEKVVIFTVKSLILYQYPVDLPTFFGTSLKQFKVFKNWQIRTC